MILRDALQNRPYGHGLRTLAAATGLFFAGVAFAGAPAVTLRVDDVGDPVIAARLLAAYQLPAWMEGVTSTGAQITPALFDDAVEREQLRLRRLMVDLGYLGAEVRLEHADGGLVFQPSLGRISTVSAVKLKGVDQSRLGRIVVDTLSSIIADYIGSLATAQAAETMGQRILYAVGQEVFATARLRQVRFVPSGNGEAVAVVDLDAGPRMHFGKVTFSGLRRLREPDLVRFIPFLQGAGYRRSLVEELRRSLEVLDSVDRVHISIDPSASNPSAVDIAVRIREASVDPTALFQDEGPGVATGLAAMAGLALLRLAPQTGISRGRQRLFLVSVSVVTAAFAGFVAMRAISFLS